MKKSLIFSTFLVSFVVGADVIRYSNDITERFIYEDWVAYKDKLRNCRPMTEFLLGGTIASFAVFSNGPLWHRHHDNSPYRSFVYGEYVQSYQLKLNGVYINHEEISHAALKKMSNSNELKIEAVLFKDYGDKSGESETFTTTASISLNGSSEAFRFCNFFN